MDRRLCLVGAIGFALALAPAASGSPPSPSLSEGPLPGTVPRSAELQRQLDAALVSRGAAYRPRTHHLEPDGSPTFTNRLILETSPYLIQHAHNPVDWYAWGPEAFERARRENRPILLSIGYSTCHWCHVMERESFEDLEIARFLNEHFVAIKVDREERPDVDDVYMSAVRLLANRGGWPLTAVLTPDLQPFFGGTYFPARTGDRGSRKGFLTILEELQTAYSSDPDELLASAADLTRRLQAAALSARPADVPQVQAIHQAAARLAESFDPVWGGFGRPPKFPRPSTHELLLRYHRRTGDPQALAIVLFSLRKMAAGGMYDQVGGGFHRYSTDTRWLVPHFEKMLYDNAQLVRLYLQAYQLSGDADLARVARETLAYVAREMTSPGGGFYSASDADSRTPGGHSEEGWFFTWTPQEIRATVGAERARVVEAYYAVTPAGNFEGRSILHTPRSPEVVAAELGLTSTKLLETIEESNRLLYAERAKRPPPLRDDKILTSWNGLMISAFARGALVLDEPRWRAQAIDAAEFVLSGLRTTEGRLLRSYMDGNARHTGYLDDYAFLIQGLIDLYEATWDPRWLRSAIELQSRQDTYYADEAKGGYFMTAADAEALLSRQKPTYDGAEPSGNSVAAMNLLRLHTYTSQPAYLERAERLFAGFAAYMRSTSAPKMLSALERYRDVPREVIVVRPADGRLDELLAVVRRTYLPNRMLTASTEGPALGAQSELIPHVAGKRALKGVTTAFVCEEGICQLPTGDPLVLAAQLDEVRPLTSGDPFPALPLRQAGKAPQPGQYDPATNRHWDPNHRHWHDGRPPVTAKTD